MSNDSGDSGKRYERFGQSRETLGVSEKIAGSHHNVGIKLAQLPNPGDSAAMPRSHVDIAQMQDAKRCASRVKDGEGFPTKGESFPLDQCTVGESPQGESPDTGKGEP
jgi:hypothetical protein